MNPSKKFASSWPAIVGAAALAALVAWFAWAWQDNQCLLSLASAQWQDRNYHQAELTMQSLHGGIVPLDDKAALELTERIQSSLIVAETPLSSPSLEVVTVPPVVFEPAPPEEEIAAPDVAVATDAEAERIIAFNEHNLAHGWVMVLSDPAPWVEALQTPTSEQKAEGAALLARHQLSNSLKEQWPNPAFPNELRLQLLNRSLEDIELVAAFNQHLLAQGWAAVQTDPAPWVALLRTPAPEQQTAAAALTARYKLSVDLTARWVAPVLPPQLVSELGNPERTDAEIQAEFLRLFQVEVTQKSEQLATAAWKTAADAKSAEAAMMSAGGLIAFLQKPGIPAAEVAELLQRVEVIQTEARTAFEARTARDLQAAAKAKAKATARLNPFKAQGWTVVDNTAGYSGYANKLQDPATGITFILVAPGEFQMGSPAEELEREDDETQHLVKIAKAFYLGETEVTQAQWRKVMTSNRAPSYFTGERLPVESVSWNDCQEFISAAGDGYRLPTEQEWEYACRAGVPTAFSWGVTIADAQANLDGRIAYAAVPARGFIGKTTRAGSLAANPWGFHDMHGNVWEWCSDWYGADASAPPESAAKRVLRGGSWINGLKYGRAANRFMKDPKTHNYVVGFRVAFDIP